MKTILMCLMAAIGFVVGLGKARAETAVGSHESPNCTVGADLRPGLQARTAPETIRKE